MEIEKVIEFKDGSLVLKEDGCLRATGDTAHKWFFQIKRAGIVSKEDLIELFEKANNCSLII
jgi:hypothetical protein